jgi:hypothetical protein
MHCASPPTPCIAYICHWPTVSGPYSDGYAFSSGWQRLQASKGGVECATAVVLLPLHTQRSAQHNDPLKHPAFIWQHICHTRICSGFAASVSTTLRNIECGCCRLNLLDADCVVACAVYPSWPDLRTCWGDEGQQQGHGATGEASVGGLPGAPVDTPSVCNHFQHRTCSLSCWFLLKWFDCSTTAVSAAAQGVVLL